MKFIYSFLLSLFFWNLSAQKVIIVDENTREPIVGVTIFNFVKTKTNISGFEGKVSITRFQNFERIYFQHISYLRKSAVKSNLNDTIFLSPKSTDLNEIVISASKFEQTRKEIPQRIISLESKDIEFANPQTSADLLNNTGTVFIQKSQLGGGSPMIRGFSTNRVLVTVDGVRLNNAIFRGGNVHNILSIDPFNIEKTEVIMGAGSVIHGSDAIGGVMNFYTTSPKLFYSDLPEVSTESNLRYSTANLEKTVHIGMNVGLSKWAFHTSMSFSDFGDLTMGDTNEDAYLTPFYITQVNGQDISIPNNNPLEQKHTAFNQLHAAQKILYKPNERVNLDFGLHYATTSNVPRYDRLSVLDQDSNLKYAEWAYGPQSWLMANTQLTKLSSKSQFYDKIKINTAYQNFKESRISRKFEATDRMIRSESVNAFSFNIDLDKLLSEKVNISYGAEYLFNRVGSEGISYDVESNDIQTIASRYPDGSTWSSLASYLSLKYKPNNRFTFQSGVRYNAISINSDLSPNSQFYPLPFLNASLDTSAMSATAGFSWEQNEIFLWKLNTTTAFRAPNIDDIGKIFDSQPGSVVVPNSSLEPEYAYGCELGLNININSSILIDVSSYYTHLDNAITRDFISINGVSEIFYDGELCQTQAVQNSSEARIYGFEAGIKARLSNSFQITSQYSLTKGRQKDSRNFDAPVRHVTPEFGNIHLIWKSDKISLDGFLNYNGILRHDNISHELSNHLFAQDQNGNPISPAWYTLNLRSQFKFSDTISFIGSIENILNEGYRPYASGISAPGANFIFAISYND